MVRRSSLAAVHRVSWSSTGVRLRNIRGFALVNCTVRPPSFKPALSGMSFEGLTVSRLKVSSMWCTPGVRARFGGVRRYRGVGWNVTGCHTGASLSCKRP
jgi:hypothetical protein